MTEDEKQIEIQKMRAEEWRHDVLWIGICIEDDLGKIVRDFNNERKI